MRDDPTPFFCVWPDRLHPASEHFLNLYLFGHMPEGEFLRFFSLPNSTYIPLGRCLVDLLTVLGLP